MTLLIKPLAHLVGQFLHIHPRRGGPFRSQPLDLAQVIDELLVLDHVFDVVRADDVIIRRDAAFPHVVEHVGIIEMLHKMSSLVALSQECLADHGRGFHWRRRSR